jgi:DNA polymerase-3 subunit alpha
VEVKIGGIVTDIKSKVQSNRNGKKEKQTMFRLRDLTGVVNAVIYADKADKHRELIQEDKIVFVRGKVTFRQGTPLIRVNDVAPLERAYEQLARSVTINLSTTGLEEKTIQGIKDVLLAYPGNCPIFIYLNTPEKQNILLKTGENFSISPSQRFIEYIQEIIGEGHLVFNH